MRFQLAYFGLVSLAYSLYNLLLGFFTAPINICLIKTTLISLLERNAEM